MLVGSDLVLKKGIESKEKKKIRSLSCIDVFLQDGSWPLWENQPPWAWEVAGGGVAGEEPRGQGPHLGNFFWDAPRPL